MVMVMPYWHRRERMLCWLPKIGKVKSQQDPEGGTRFSWRAASRTSRGDVILVDTNILSIRIFLIQPSAGVPIALAEEIGTYGHDR